MTVTSQIYEENRRVLWGLCYRMTGNAADAEEIVQETFIKALENPPEDTQKEWRPWLLRVAVNLSRDRLRRRRRSGYPGPWLPSPISAGGARDLDSAEPAAPAEDSPQARYNMTESVMFAFLLAMETLSPSQRAVLLLRDVFDYSTNETAGVLGMKETAVKVALHRARRVMSDYDRTRKLPAPALCEMTRRALERFLHCLETRDSQGLERLLAEDVVVISDGGGEVTALTAPMQGRSKVLQLVTRLFEVYRDSMTITFDSLNGVPALLVRRSNVKEGHASRYTMHCEIDEAGVIRRLNYVFAPSKLTAVK